MSKFNNYPAVTTLAAADLVLIYSNSLAAVRTITAANLASEILTSRATGIVATLGGLTVTAAATLTGGFVASANSFITSGAGYQLMVGFTGGDAVGIVGLPTGQGAAFVFQDPALGLFRPAILDASDYIFKLGGATKFAINTTGIIATSNPSYTTWQGPSGLSDLIFTQRETSSGGYSTLTVGAGPARVLLAKASGTFAAKTAVGTNSVVGRLEFDAYEGANVWDNISKIDVGTSTSVSTPYQLSQVNPSGGAAALSAILNYNGKWYLSTSAVPMAAAFGAPYVDTSNPWGNLWPVSTNSLATDGNFLVGRANNGTGTDVSALSIWGGSGTAGGAYLSFITNTTTRAQVGTRAAILGSGTDQGLTALSATNFYVYTGLATLTATFSTTGLAVTKPVSIGTSPAITAVGELLNVQGYIVCQSTTAPYVNWYATSNGANLKWNRVGTDSNGDLKFETVNDAYNSATVLMTLSRAGSLTAIGFVRTGGYTVATLPAAATAGAGARTYVTDANATTFMSTVAGGGGNIVPVFSDGTNWKIA